MVSFPLSSSSILRSLWVSAVQWAPSQETRYQSSFLQMTLLFYELFSRAPHLAKLGRSIMKQYRAPYELPNQSRLHFYFTLHRCCEWEPLGNSQSLEHPPQRDLGIWGVYTSTFVSFGARAAPGGLTSSALPACHLHSTLDSGNQRKPSGKWM